MEPLVFNSNQAVGDTGCQEDDTCYTNSGRNDRLDGELFNFVPSFSGLCRTIGRC